MTADKQVRKISLGSDFGPVVINANNASFQIDSDGTIHSQEVSEAPKKPKTHSSALVYRSVTGLKAAWNWATGNTRLEKRGIPFSKEDKQGVSGSTIGFCSAAGIVALMGLLSRTMGDPVNIATAPIVFTASAILGGIAALFPVSSHIVSAYRAGRFDTQQKLSQQSNVAKQQPSPG